MKKTARQEQLILEKLKSSKRMSLAEAMEILQVSESTIRRLFIRLENKGVAVRNYGSIQLIHSRPPAEYSYEEVEGQFVEKKKVIGRQAALMIESGDTLYLDSGTTMSQLCLALSQRLKNKELEQLTIFTNSLVNLDILSRQMTVNLIGGEYRANRKDFCGYLSEELLKDLHFTKCFLGADGFHLHNGFTATDFHTARLNEIVLQNSDKRYVVMDSSKFLTASVVSYSRNQTIEAIITDQQPEDEAIRQRLAEQKTEMVVCPAEPL